MKYLQKKKKKMSMHFFPDLFVEQPMNTNFPIFLFFSLALGHNILQQWDFLRRIGITYCVDTQSSYI